MLSGSFLCPNVPQVSHCHSLVQVSLLTKVFVIDLRASATAGPPVNECPLWGDCPPVGGSHIECPGWCLLVVSTVTSRLFLTFKRHPSRVLILENKSVFHIDSSTVASSVHRWVTSSVHYGLGHLSVSRRRPLLLAIVPSSPQSGGIFTYLVSISVTLLYIALQYCIWCPPALHNFTLLCNQSYCRVHLIYIGPYTRVHLIYITLHSSSITCRVLCQLASIEDTWVRAWRQKYF